LLEIDERLTAAVVMALPMNRRDIVDYLGVTIETVSRALSQLHGAGMLISLAKRSANSLPIVHSAT
jgi:CRP/FNR family nitrogen fixation transcriptional regulator